MFHRGLMKPDEKGLLNAVQAKPRSLSVRAVVQKLGIHEERAAAILIKWVNKGWYEYEVYIDLGWLTEEGKNK